MRFLLLGLVSLLLGPTSGYAQSTPPGPLPSHLRIWFAFPPDQPSPADGEAPTLKTHFELWQIGTSPRRLAKCRRPYQVENFRVMRPGSLGVSLRRMTEPASEVATQNLPLKEGGWYTLLIRPEAGGVKMVMWEDRLQKRPKASDEKSLDKVPEKIKLAAASLLDNVTAKISFPKTGQVVAWNSRMEPGQDLLEVPQGVFEIQVEGTWGTKAFRRDLFWEAVPGDRPVLLFTQDIYGRLGVALAQLPAPEPSL